MSHQRPGNRVTQRGCAVHSRDLVLFTLPRMADCADRNAGSHSTSDYAGALQSQGVRRVKSSVWRAVGLRRGVADGCRERSDAV